MGWKEWLIAGVLLAAYGVVPMLVYWLRHRPRRLEVPTQHLVLAGLLAQILLLVMAFLIWWLG